MIPIQPQDFLSLAYPASLALSPDGAFCAWLEYTADLSGNAYSAALKLSSCLSECPMNLACTEKPAAICWEDNDHLLYISARSEKTVLHRIHIRSGRDQFVSCLPAAVSSLCPLSDGRLLVLVKTDFRPSITPEFSVLDEIPFWANGRGITNGRRTRLCIWDGSALTPITPEDSEIGTFSVHESEILYSIRYRLDKKMKFAALCRFDLTDGSTVQLMEPDRYDIFGAWRIGEQILVSATDMDIWGNVQNPDFYRIPIASSWKSNSQKPPAYEKFLTADLGVTNDVTSDARYGSSSQWVVCGDRLYFIATTRAGSRLYCLDVSGRIEALTEDDGRTVTGISAACGRLAMIQETPSRCGEVFLCRPDGDCQRISHCNDGYFSSHDPIPPVHISFRSREKEIDGYVIPPAGFDPSKRYPGVLQIHGGPKLAYGSVFHMEMQAMAARGWFVFFCNPAGSDGRGNQFMDLRGLYGSIDYEDLMNFTDAVLKQYPQLDSDRLAVCGGSYGGFMVNWIITRTGRFRCAVSQRSISNWVSMFCTSDIGYRFVGDQLDGTPWTEPRRFWEQSPVSHAHKVSTPTLFIHADQDFRCPMGEGLQMFTALRYFGVESRLCLLHGENHELSRGGRPRQRMKRLEEIFHWLESHL